MEFVELKRDIEKYASVLSSVEDVSEQTRTEALLCRDVLLVIAPNGRDYDATTVIARINWGDFLETAFRQKDTSPKTIRDMLFALAQCTREHCLRRNYAPQPPVSALLDYVQPNNPIFDFNDRQQADYVWSGLPKDIIVDLIGNHVKKQTEHESKLAIWEQNLTEWDKRVKKHETTLKNYHQRYNFVELAKAFSEMYGGKEAEKNRLLSLLLVSGITLIVPILAQLPLGEAFPLLSGLRVTWTLEQWPKAIPLAALEALMFYFFRILLHNYSSAKAQLLQLDLRQALCAFIESYVEFAKEKVQGQKDANPLNKFEALVFSGLTPDPEKVPSSFDGFEQLIKMAKEFKKKD